MASEVELIDLLSGKRSLTLLAFPPMNPWLPILHADLCLCCSHCNIYLLMRALFSKNLIAESKDWNKDARVWNLKQVLERKAGVPGITSHILILTPFLCELSSVNCLSDAHCLYKEFLLLRILVSSLFLSVIEQLIWTLVISHFHQNLTLS